MLAFISQSTENGRTKFLIDTNIFPVEISMKAAYAFLDRAYFLFKKDGENLIVQIHPKPWQELSGEHFALEFSDELLATYLRAKIEEENKVIRETIVRRALWSYADLPNFTSVNVSQKTSTQIDFDKDIDEILKEIENDPELKIDQEEISRILAEIESETASEHAKKTPKIDPNKIKNAKKNFQHR